MADMTNNELLLSISNMMDQKLQPIHDSIDQINGKIVQIDKRLTNIESRVTGIEVSIENEIMHGIKIIAEGHLDLNRNLNETIHSMHDLRAKHEVYDLLLKSHESRLKIKDLFSGNAV